MDGTQAQFSCKTTANPDLWDTKGGRMIGKSMQALEVNRKLDKMRVSISKHYQEIMDRDNFVTADKVKNATAGNFAALDESGNMTDSGKKPADFVAAETGKRLMTNAEGEKLKGISAGATKTAASETNGHITIDGVDTTVYTEPSDVIHGTVASDSDVTAMLTEVFGA